MSILEKDVKRIGLQQKDVQIRIEKLCNGKDYGILEASILNKTAGWMIFSDYHLSHRGYHYSFGCITPIDGPEIHRQSINAMLNSALENYKPSCNASPM